MNILSAFATPVISDDLIGESIATMLGLTEFSPDCDINVQTIRPRRVREPGKYPSVMERYRHDKIKALAAAMRL